MRLRYFIFFLIIDLLLAIIIIHPVFADSPPTSTAGHIDPAGNVVGQNGSLSTAEATVQPLTNPIILCFTTKFGDDDPCLRVAELFTQVTIVRSIAGFPADLAPYDVVYTGYEEGALLEAKAVQIEAYVKQGGGLIVSEPDLAGTVNVYPPDFEMTVTDVDWPDFSDDNPSLEFTGAGAAHPILKGLTPGDLSGYFETVPIHLLGPGWTVLAKSKKYPHATLAAGVYGSGRLVFHSGNIVAFFEHFNHEHDLGGSDLYVQQMIQWAGADQPDGLDMQIEAIEVTQAIQDLNNSVDLIADKRTYARVHVSVPTTITDVTARLSGERDGQTLFPTLIPRNPGADITILSNPDRGQLNDSFWFELPTSWGATGSLTLTAHIDPADTKGDPNHANNSQSVTVNFNETPPLQLRLHNVQYRVGGTTYLADDIHLERVRSWLGRAYPISTITYEPQLFVYPRSGLPRARRLNFGLLVSKLLRIFFTGEDRRMIYYGLVDDGGGYMSGRTFGSRARVASGPTGVPSGRFSWDTDGSYGDWQAGHKIGHIYRRRDAKFCWRKWSRRYPYPHGRISPTRSGDTAIYGFDAHDQAIYPPTWKDVMTYCQNIWISDFTYEGIGDYMVSVGGISAPLNAAAADKSLLVSGLVDLNDFTGQLEDVYLLGQGQQTLPEPGDWSIVLLDASNADLAAYPFTPYELSGSEESEEAPAVVAEIVPWVDTARKLELRHNGQVIDSRTTSANAPEASITAPQQGQQLSDDPFTLEWSAADADGDPLIYSVLYSNDNGQSWDILSVGLDQSQLEIDIALLPGGDSSLLRVIASDGLLTAMDTVGPFSVPTDGPEVKIISPLDGETFFPTQLVALKGNVYDAEDGQLEGQALQWSSSLDGDLGSGAALDTIDLSTGEHIITLIATDSNGQTGQAQITIEVLSGDAPEPAILEVAPGAVAATIGVGSGPQSYTFSVRNSGESLLNWTTSDNAPWLEVSHVSGATPSDLILTIDPTGLELGDYQAEITIQTGQATNSPLVVPVALDIIPLQETYLPTIIK